MNTIDEAMRKIEAHISRVQRRVALQGLSGVVMKTPVDTGRARANWGVGVNSRPSGTTDATDKGGGGVVTKGSGEIGSAPAYSEIYLVNNLPYIEKLENGSSQQAPNGMVNVTVAEIEAQARLLAKG